MTWQEVRLLLLVMVLGSAWVISYMLVYHRGWCTGFEEHRQIVDRVRGRRGR